MTDIKEKKKTSRPRIEKIVPTDIVDVWRLVECAIRDSGEVYPDCTEDSAEVIRSHVFAYMMQPTFCGLIARVGRRPVALVMGHVECRPYGRPSRFASIKYLWVDFKFRKMGIGKTIWEQYAKAMKAEQVFHVEARASGALAASMPWLSKLSNVIGGRI